MVYSIDMKNLLLTASKGKAESKTIQKLASQAGFRVETRPLESLKQTTNAPDVTFVDVDNPASLAKVMRDVAQIQSRAPMTSHVIFSVKTPSRAEKKQTQTYSDIINAITGQLKIFPNPALVDVRFDQTDERLSALLNYMGHKIDLAREISGIELHAAPRSSPLDTVKGVIKATEDLRVENGKLSAEAVAKTFKVTMSELADWLGRSRQAVSKTPDADSLQNELEFFERIARLRTVISKGDFLKWLRMPNRELDGKRPLEFLANGEGQVVADLVDDMLTGAPA